MKTRGFGRRDDQVLPAQEAGAGAGLPAVAAKSPPHSSHLNGTILPLAIPHLAPCPSRGQQQEHVS